MVWEVSRLLTADIRNLTHGKKYVFCPLLISEFRSGFKHFPTKGFATPSNHTPYLGPILELITMSQGYKTLICQVQDSYSIMLSGVGSVPLNPKVWGGERGSSPGGIRIVYPKIRRNENWAGKHNKPHHNAVLFHILSQKWELRTSFLKP